MPKSRRLFLVVLSFMFAGLVSMPVSAQVDFETKAEFGVLMDFDTGTLLFQKKADAPMAPASMAKLMTVAVAFDMLRKGSLSLDEEFNISKTAFDEGGARSGGSTMFANLNSDVPVRDLLRSIIIQSGNDAAIALAEGIAGSESVFVRLMNQEAKKIGLEDSNFTNSTGLPDEDMYVSARDLALLARYIIKEYPEYYSWFAEEEMIWNKVRQPNRNTLVNDDLGIDGLKTGHTDASGYGIVASSKNEGRRLITVLNGMKTKRDRVQEARKLLRWGERAFDTVTPFAIGESVGSVGVYGGAEASVGLLPESQLVLYLPKGQQSCIRGRILYDFPILPPVEKGDQIAQLEIKCNGKVIQTTKLYAAESVDKGNIIRQASDALKELALGWM